MTQTLQCYKCGTENTLGSQFCTTCGEKFIYTCPQCNTNIKPGDEYCSHCAARLNWGTVPEQTIEANSGQSELTSAQSLEFKKDKATERKFHFLKGINPWLIALIITILLIVAIFVIDKVVDF